MQETATQQLLYLIHIMHSTCCKNITIISGEEERKKEQNKERKNEKR
jgi:hypothetical protein